MKGMKYYAVAAGRKCGVFLTWEECKAQVHGFSGAKYKSFRSKGEAEAYVAANACSPAQSWGRARSARSSVEREALEESLSPRAELIENSPIQEAEGYMVSPMREEVPAPAPLSSFSPAQTEAIVLHVAKAFTHESGCGFYQLRDVRGSLLFQQSLYLGEATNTEEVEVTALVLGLMECLERRQLRVVVSAESEELVKSLGSQQLPENKRMRELLQRAGELRMRFETFEVDNST